ncbi:MAG: DUF2877 domain-containing protein [bacterium]
MEQHRTGRILATFARSAYLDFDGAIVALVTEDLLNGPLNVVLPAEPAPPFDRLTAGRTVTASAEAIRIEGWPPVSVLDAACWDPRITPWTTAEMARATTHLGVLTDVVMADAPTDHLTHPRLQRGLAALESGLTARSSTDVDNAAADLAGLGGGLTPTGDDILVGVLVVLAAVADGQIQILRNAIHDAVAGRTTRISAAYLDAAARGEASEAWHRLLTALAGNEPDEVIEAGRRVRTYGETSGTDMLAGFLSGMGAFGVPQRPATGLPK